MKLNREKLQASLGLILGVGLTMSSPKLGADISLVHSAVNQFNVSAFSNSSVLLGGNDMLEPITTALIMAIAIRLDADLTCGIIHEVGTPDHKSLCGSLCHVNLRYLCLPESVSQNIF